MSSASSAPASSAPACWYPGRRALDPPIQYQRQADDAVPVQHLRVHYWHDMDHESRAAIHATRLKTRLKDERVHKSHILCGVGRRPLARVVLPTGTSTSRRLVHVAPRVLAPDCLHVTDEALKNHGLLHSTYPSACSSGHGGSCYCPALHPPRGARLHVTRPRFGLDGRGVTQLTGLALNFA